MNLIQKLMVAIAMLASSTGQATPLDGPIKVGVPFNHAYIPDGFDDNDVVQFVAEGLFTNSCYRQTQPTVDVDHESRVISVGPVAYKYEGFCLQVVLPFDRVIDVGVLKAGRYKVVQSAERKVLGEIDVKPASTIAPDDHLYAPVSQAYVRSRGSKSNVYLSGNFPVSCMKIKEIRTLIQNEVLALQPIAEIDPSVPCQAGVFPFETRAESGPMTTGRYLLHVRSLNGKAINSLFDVP